jgi:hypothetical protein
MKTFLRFSLAAMLLAGIYGFADLIHDIQYGTLIHYERDSGSAAARQRKTKLPPTSLQSKNWLTALSLLSMNPRSNQTRPIQVFSKENQPGRLSKLNIRSFSRSSISFSPAEISFEDAGIIPVSTLDSLKKQDTERLRALIKTETAALQQGLKDSSGFQGE